MQRLVQLGFINYLKPNYGFHRQPGRSIDRWVDRESEPGLGRYAHAEFSYNNSYQASLKMSPFEALYGSNCWTPMMWSEVGERSFFGAAKIKDAEGVTQVRENLRIAQSRQKSYADKRRRDLEFEVGDYIYLKVSPL